MIFHLFIFVSTSAGKYPKYLLIWQLLRIMQAKMLGRSIFYMHNFSYAQTTNISCRYFFKNN